eukprot:TRINITY_DN1093_c2_g1_i1.p1 TRINITY_DN1093_c2_g1~~TRINITY_DN1093_c2_g1_i1.p1  ORF type:complete len:1456 (+),score=574.74 TRINITY_DN1093_c2_g1_i1:63-4370(+)
MAASDTALLEARRELLRHAGDADDDDDDEEDGDDDDSEDSSSPYIGLVNLGSTCYLNSLIQCWFHTPYLREAVYAIGDGDGGMTTALQLLFYTLTHQKYPASTKALTEAFGWRTEELAQQQDLHELCIKLREKLEGKMKGTPSEDALNYLFRGWQDNVVRTLDGGFESTRREAFCEIQLEIKGNRDIHEALRALVRAERLDGGNKYKVERPGAEAEYKEADKFLQFRTFPPVQVFHLKRFDIDYFSDTLEQQKLFDRFEYPEALDLSEYETGLPADGGEHGNPEAGNPLYDPASPAAYRLHSVIVHAGGPQSGHYYAYLRPDIRSNEWYEFNDTSVTRVGEEQVFDGAFGGRTWVNSWGVEQVVPATSYILNYIRTSCIDKVFPPHTPSGTAVADAGAVPPSVIRAYHEEATKTREMQRLKLEASKRVMVYLTRDADIAEAVGEHQVDLHEGGAAAPIRGMYCKNDSIGHLRRQIEAQTGIAPAHQRLWGWNVFARRDAAKWCHPVLSPSDPDGMLLEERWEAFMRPDELYALHAYLEEARPLVPEYRPVYPPHGIDIAAAGQPLQTSTFVSKRTGAVHAAEHALLQDRQYIAETALEDEAPIFSVALPHGDEGTDEAGRWFIRRVVVKHRPERHVAHRFQNISVEIYDEVPNEDPAPRQGTSPAAAAPRHVDPTAGLPESEDGPAPEASSSAAAAPPRPVLKKVFDYAAQCGGGQLFNPRNRLDGPAGVAIHFSADGGGPPLPDVESGDSDSDADDSAEEEDDDADEDDDVSSDDGAALTGEWDRGVGARPAPQKASRRRPTPVTCRMAGGGVRGSRVVVRKVNKDYPPPPPLAPQGGAPGGGPTALYEYQLAYDEERWGYPCALGAAEWLRNRTLAVGGVEVWVDPPVWEGGAAASPDGRVLLPYNPQTHLLLMLKYYDPAAAKLRYLGSHVVHQQELVRSLVPVCLRLAGLPADALDGAGGAGYLFFDEATATSIYPLAAPESRTFAQQTLLPGNILTFQLFDRATAAQHEYPTAAAYYSHLADLLTVAFEPLPPASPEGAKRPAPAAEDAGKSPRPTEGLLELALSGSHRYEDVAEALGAAVGEDPARIRLWVIGEYGEPKDAPEKRADNRTLRDMLLSGWEVAPYLYYDVLKDATVLEAEERIPLQVGLCKANGEVVAVKNITVTAGQPIADVITALEAEPGYPFTDALWAAMQGIGNGEAGSDVPEGGAPVPHAQLVLLEIAMHMIRAQYTADARLPPLDPEHIYELRPIPPPVAGAAAEGDAALNVLQFADRPHSWTGRTMTEVHSTPFQIRVTAGETWAAFLDRMLAFLSLPREEVSEPPLYVARANEPHHAVTDMTQPALTHLQLLARGGRVVIVGLKRPKPRVNIKHMYSKRQAAPEKSLWIASPTKAKNPVDAAEAVFPDSPVPLPDVDAAHSSDAPDGVEGAS